jgi:hypothetical protein
MLQKTQGRAFIRLNGLKKLPPERSWNPPCASGVENRFKLASSSGQLN